MQACDYLSIIDLKQKTHRFRPNCASEVMHLRGQGQMIYCGGSLVCFLYGSSVCQTSLFITAGLIILLLWLNATDDCMPHSRAQPTFCLSLSDIPSSKNGLQRFIFAHRVCVCIYNSLCMCVSIVQEKIIHLKVDKAPCVHVCVGSRVFAEMF